MDGIDKLSRMIAQIDARLGEVKEEHLSEDNKDFYYNYKYKQEKKLKETQSLEENDLDNAEGK